MQETQEDSGLIPGSGRSPGGGHGNPLQCSCLENPMDREPGRLQSMGSQRVGHNWATNTGAIGSLRKKKKAQTSKPQVKYLGYIINPGSRQLSPYRKEAILGLSAPKTNKQKSSFLRCGRILQNLDSRIQTSGQASVWSHLRPRYRTITLD